MIRTAFGSVLPSIDDARIGDRFILTTTGKEYVFDDGEWIEKEKAN